MKKEIKNQITEILDRVYPEKWDFYTPDSILLHFPEVITDNSIGTKWTHCDVFILLIFKNDVLYSMHGDRSTLYAVEFRKDYVHPHISRQGVILNGNCCLGGNTEISFLKQELSLAFDPFLFESFCYALHTWLSWESLEGGPYSGGTSALFSKSCDAEDIEDWIIEEEIQHFLDYTESIPVQFEEKGIYSTYKCILSPENLRDLLKNRVHDTGKYIFDRGVARRYVPLEKESDTELEVMTEELRKHKTSFKFKGQDIIYKVIQNPLNKKINIPSETVHPEIIESIQKRLTKIINEEERKKQIGA